MKRIVEVAVLPGVLGGALAVVWLGLRVGSDPFLCVTATLLVTAAVVLVLQRVLPAVGDWRWWGRDAAIDALHTLVSSGGASAGVRAVLLPVAIGVQGALSSALGSTPWPSDLPLAVQLVLALVVGDLGAYWLHRLSHTVAPLWRLHALHHSSERLYVLSSGRNHPLHTSLTWAVEVLPLAALGAGPHVLALHAAFTGVNGLLQHANISMRPGLLNRVLATCDVHRWHHSTIELESRTNFGNNLVLWDYVFRTYHLRPGAPERVGIEGFVFPRHVLAHLASPFLLPRFEDRGSVQKFCEASAD